MKSGTNHIQEQKNVTLPPFLTNKICRDKEGYIALKDHRKDLVHGSTFPKILDFRVAKKAD